MTIPECVPSSAVLWPAERLIPALTVKNAVHPVYGRVVYVNDADDLRLFGPVQRGSDKWKKIYNNRTCTERINTRILNDYHLHQMMIRNDSKQMFFAIFACINIHLDAWAKDELKS